MPPLRIQNPQLRVAIEVRQSVTFNNLTNSISKKRGRASREIVHPQPGRASGCLSPVRAKRAVRCCGAQTFFFFFNESNSREADFYRSTGKSVCAAGVRDEDVGGGYEGGRGEQKKRKGRERNVTNTSDVVGRKGAPRRARREEITTTKSLAVLTYQTVLRVRPAWHDF